MDAKSSCKCRAKTHRLTTGRSIAADPSVCNFLLEIRSAEPLNSTGHAYGYEFLFFLSYFRTKEVRVFVTGQSASLISYVVSKVSKLRGQKRAKERPTLRRPDEKPRFLPQATHSRKTWHRICNCCGGNVNATTSYILHDDRWRSHYGRHAIRKSDNPTQAKTHWLTVYSMENMIVNRFNNSAMDIALFLVLSSLIIGRYSGLQVRGQA